MTLRTLLLGSILFALAGCGQGQNGPPEKPQITTDRDSLGFGLEFGSATYVNTQPQESLLIENNGVEDLVISSVALQGPDKGSFSFTGPDKTTVTQGKHAFVSLVFKPTQARDYAAQFVIHSNAENMPDKVIDLQGRGVNP